MKTDRKDHLRNNPGGYIYVDVDDDIVDLSIPSCITMTPTIARLLAQELNERADEAEAWRLAHGVEENKK